MTVLRRLLSFLSAAFAISVSAQAQVINIDAQNNRGVAVHLGAGTHSFSFIGVAEGGAYDAWNAWGETTGCDSLVQ
jgi:hypothetical protein